MRVLDLARPETVHEYRLAFHKARTIKRAQDGFCSKLKEGYAATSTPERAVGRLRKDGFEATEEFPGDSDSTWDIETIVSLLHGNVKAMTHCYTTLDFNSFLRVSRARTSRTFVVTDGTANLRISSRTSLSLRLKRSTTHTRHT